MLPSQLRYHANTEMHGSCILGSSRSQVFYHSSSCTPFRLTAREVLQKGLRSCTVDMSISTAKLVNLEVRFYPMNFATLLRVDLAL